MASETGAGTSPKRLFVTSLTQTSTKDLEGVGTTRGDQYGNKYRWIQHVGTAAKPATHVGAPALYDGTDVAATTFLEQVGSDLIDSTDSPYLAGIHVSAIAISSYGWILTEGIYGTAQIEFTAVAANEMLAPNVTTDTTETDEARAYAFGEPATEFNVTYGGDTTIVLRSMLFPHAIAIVAVATSSGVSNSTAAITGKVFVSGLIK